jgi:subtilisin-like proprotein convertase family protein
MKRVLALTAIGALALAGCTGSQDEPGGAAVDLPATALAQIEGLIAEKAARSPAQRKIGSALLYAQSGRFKGTEGKAAIESLLARDADGRVLVDVKGDLGAGLGGRVDALGGKVVHVTPAQRAMRAWMPLPRIEELAADAAVQAVRPAFMATTWRAAAPRQASKLAAPESRAERVAAVQRAIAERSELASAKPAAGTNGGSVTSEGSQAHGADRARKFYGTDGSGVKIGVLSDSDDFAEQSIASGDLPADLVTIPGQDGRPGSGEGTAMLEIIHDVAPGAKLFFATAFISPESFADNIRRLRFEYGCDIIVDDIIYYAEAPYQDDIIAQAVADVTADGALYFSSAGNGGNVDDGTSGVWEGDFKNGGALGALSGYAVHDFGNKVISNRLETSGGPVILHWSDPGTMDNPQSSNDYDLFLLDPTLREVVVSATDVQDGTGLPFEWLPYNIPAGYRVVVARAAGAQTRAIRLQFFGGELGIGTAGSTFGHNSAYDAIGVAAVDVALAELDGGEFTAGQTTPVEEFSSDGPRRIFYDRHGNRIKGGVTFASGGGELRLKPELSAADGVATTLPPSSGLNPFFGTSAAAPHAAAIAALIKAARPGLSAFEIRLAMHLSALDIEGQGFDRNSGSGVVAAQAALRQAGARPAVFLELGQVTTTPASGDVVIPGGGGSITAELLNDGGATARTVRATLSSSTPGVTVTGASASYPNLAAGAAAGGATPFTFTVDPSVPCGTVLDFTLTVTYSGNGPSPKVFGFSVLTGRAGTPVNYAYTGAPVAIPDGNSAGVSIPFEVAASGAVSTVSFRIDGTSCSSAIGSTTVGIDHTWIGDLVLRLTSPSGTTVTVINQAGGGLNSGNNFCQTVLQDGAASSIQAVTSAGAPYSGTFAPANPQAAFAGDSAGGTWTLNVSDLVSFDSGSVRAFSLDISGFDCTPAP